MFFKILGAGRWLFTMMDGHTGFTLAYNASGTKMAYKPLPLFTAARKMASVVPWVFVTDGPRAFQGAAIKAFRRAGGFRLVHVKDIRLKNKFAGNNMCERLNGEIVDRAKTVMAFNLAPDPERDSLLWGGCPAMVRTRIIIPSGPTGAGRQDPRRGDGDIHRQGRQVRHDDMERHGKGQGGRQGRRSRGRRRLDDHKCPTQSFEWRERAGQTWCGAPCRAMRRRAAPSMSTAEQMCAYRGMGPSIVAVVCRKNGRKPHPPSLQQNPKPFALYAGGCKT